MFTLKFCSFCGEDNDYEKSLTVICCPHYNTYHFKNRVEVTVYKDFTSVEGVTYTLSEEDLLGKPYWQVCYVENVNGKTIDTIRTHS